MFPSINYNCNGIDPISNNDQRVPNMQFLYDIITTTNPIQDDFPLSSFYFPSPLLPSYEFELDDYGFDLQQDNDLFHHNQPLIATNISNCNTQEVMINEPTKESQSNHQQIPIRRRPSKRDRHGKINTAQGPRDRRMRLSFKVAKEFFGVQDKLGFDKASKTVEWLLIQAKPSIEKLFNSPPEMENWSFRSASLASECEVVSSVDEAAIEAINIFKEKPSPRGEKKRVTRSSHNTTTQQLARESRDKARARARKRTLEKMWIASEARKGTDVQGNDPSNLEIPSGVNVPLMSYKQGDLVDHSMAIMEESILNYMQSSDVFQELQFKDFQAFYKLW